MIVRNHEPQWQDAGSVCLQDVPAALVSWLLYRKSLTRRIQRQCNGQFAVHVISQCWQRPLFSERQVLSLPDREICLVRQVCLLCCGQPWVFARTVMPASTLTGERRQLACLGSRPLGARLFADRRIHRHTNELARLRPAHAIYQMATNWSGFRPAEIWGRRSVYEYSGRPLLVNEIFLPELLQAGAGEEDVQAGLTRRVAHAC